MGGRSGTRGRKGLTYTELGLTARPSAALHPASGGEERNEKPQEEEEREKRTQRLWG